MELIIRLLRDFLCSLWSVYRKYIEDSILHQKREDIRDLEYYQDRLFYHAVLYAIPVSIVVAVSCAVIQYREGNTCLAVLGLLAVILIPFITLNSKIRLNVRKVVVVMLGTLFSVWFMIAMSSFTIGCIYLFALSIFISLQYPPKYGFAWVGVNFLICLCLGIFIVLKPGLTALSVRYSPSQWWVYSANLLFVNFLIVALIYKVIRGLRETIIAEGVLLKRLHTELEENALRSMRLEESEDHYKKLFFNNPSPMWIFDHDTLGFLQVNDAALKRYGFMRSEFYLKTVADFISEEQLNTLHGMPVRTTQTAKDGRVFHVELRMCGIRFGEKRAYLTIVNDISLQVQQIEAIERQNEKLREIAFIQSHLIRAPLSRILGLTALLMEDADSPSDRELLGYLDTSAKELDELIRSIVRNSEDDFQA